MSVDIDKKLKQAAMAVAFCGVVGTAYSVKAIHDDIQKNVPEKIVGPDGHMGSKLSDKQALLALAGGLSATIAGVAGVFGKYLKDEEDKKKQQTMSMLKTKQLSR